MFPWKYIFKRSIFHCYVSLGECIEVSICYDIKVFWEHLSSLQWICEVSEKQKYIITNPKAKAAGFPEKMEERKQLPKKNADRLCVFL